VWDTDEDSDEELNFNVRFDDETNTLHVYPNPLTSTGIPIWTPIRALTGFPTCVPRGPRGFSIDDAMKKLRKVPDGEFVYIKNVVGDTTRYKTVGESDGIRTHRFALGLRAESKLTGTLTRVKRTSFKNTEDITIYSRHTAGFYEVLYDDAEFPAFYPAYVSFTSRTKTDKVNVCWLDRTLGDKNDVYEKVTIYAGTDTDITHGPTEYYITRA